MTDIDPDIVRPGDTVRVRFQNIPMEKAGIPPIEFTTTAHGEVGDVWAGNLIIAEKAGITILEHVPARPDWADAKVLKVDGYGILQRAAKQTSPDLYLTSSGSVVSVGTIVEFGLKVTIVLDGDGQNVEAIKVENRHMETIGKLQKELREETARREDWRNETYEARTRAAKAKLELKSAKRDTRMAEDGADEWRTPFDRSEELRKELERELEKCRAIADRWRAEAERYEAEKGTAPTDDPF